MKTHSYHSYTMFSGCTSLKITHGQKTLKLFSAFFQKCISIVELQRLTLHNHKSFQKYKYWKGAALGNWVKHCNVWVVAWWKCKTASVTLSHGSPFYDSERKAKRVFLDFRFSATVKIYDQLYLLTFISKAFASYVKSNLCLNICYYATHQMGSCLKIACSHLRHLCMQSFKWTAVLPICI